MSKSSVLSLFGLTLCGPGQAEGEPAGPPRVTHLELLELGLLHRPDEPGGGDRVRRRALSVSPRRMAMPPPRGYDSRALKDPWDLPLGLRNGGASGWDLPGKGREVCTNQASNAV